MSYLALDLDAKKLVPRVARAVGLSPGDVVWGLLELWEWAWLEKTSIAPHVVVTGCIGATPGLIDALVGFDFLEPVDGGYQIRGTEKYLNVAAGRSKGGRKAAQNGNLKRGAHLGTQKPVSQVVPSLPPAEPPAEPQLDARLSPNTQHPTPNTVEAKSIVELETPPGPVRQVFEYWQTKLNHPRAKLDGKRRRAVQARLDEGRAVDELKAAIDGCAVTPHNIGLNERGERFDDLELICRNDAQVERFICNAQAPPVAPRSASAPVQPSSFATNVGPVVATEGSLF